MKTAQGSLNVNLKNLIQGEANPECDYWNLLLKIDQKFDTHVRTFSAYTPSESQLPHFDCAAPATGELVFPSDFSMKGYGALFLPYNSVAVEEILDRILVRPKFNMAIHHQENPQRAYLVPDFSFEGQFDFDHLMTGEIYQPRRNIYSIQEDEDEYENEEVEEKDEDTNVSISDEGDHEPLIGSIPMLNAKLQFPSTRLSSMKPHKGDIDDIEDDSFDGAINLTDESDGELVEEMAEDVKEESDLDDSIVHFEANDSVFDGEGTQPLFFCLMVPRYDIILEDRYSARDLEDLKGRVIEALRLLEYAYLVGYDVSLGPVKFFTSKIHEKTLLVLDPKAKESNTDTFYSPKSVKVLSGLANFFKTIDFESKERIFPQLSKLSNNILLEDVKEGLGEWYIEDIRKLCVLQNKPLGKRSLSRIAI